MPGTKSGRDPAQSGIQPAHMKWLAPWLLAASVCPGIATPIRPLDPATRPTIIPSDALTEFASLPQARRQMIETALAVAALSPWLPYLAGGADPAAGGFDCSGAIYFVLRKAGLDPPRDSGGQMKWLERHGRLHPVSNEARDRTHPSLANLKPGDLLFWARKHEKDAIRVHHVAMYLGTERQDGHPVMIGSTDGRSYRGQVANGYGVQDFRVPAKDSPSMLIGYGTPPGLAIE